MLTVTLQTHLANALACRSALFDARHEAAFRLFNGFTEGQPALVADLYAASLVLHNYADVPDDGRLLVEEAAAFYREALPWLRAIIVKTRNTRNERERNGMLLMGNAPDHWVRENGVRYAVDLTLNRDASFYLDTRHVREWATHRLAGKSVLNTFAYTGSLGVAAVAGGASRVVYLDLNRQFLNVAKTSYTLNGYPIPRPDFRAEDFWPATNTLKRAGELFDCVFLDPPYFAVTPRGTVDMAHNSTRLINKVRPLINDGGWLVVINNALFLSGRDFMRELEALCADGYLSIETQIPVPDDYTGYAETRVADYPIDPAPFNHPTKMVVLRVRRKPASHPLTV